MAVVRKNIWLIFYTLFLFALFFFLLVSYFRWNSTFTKHQIAQENMVRLMAASTHSLFSTQELLLDILGRRLVEDASYKNNQKAIKTLNNLLVLNPSVFAFGLLTPEGNYTFLSSQSDLSNLPNLKEQPQSKESFMDTLASKRMVIGRTYYFKPLQEWVIPIRKTIRDDKETILAVMTGALKLNDTFEPLLKSLHEKENHVISIIRERDFYRQYQSNPDAYEDIYNKPTSSSLIAEFHQKVLETYGVSAHELRRDENLISLTIHSSLGQKVLASAKYDQTYGLWIVVQTYYHVIIADFLESFVWYGFIFILVSTGFFFLFKVVSKAEIKRNAELLFQATHDPLTGLPNRLFLQKNIDKWFLEERPFSILYLDIDNFKNINDNFGHYVGDTLLCELSHRIKIHFPDIPKEAIIIRYGGDEFAIFTYITDDNALIVFANRLIKTISKAYLIDGLRLLVGASIGIAKFPQHGTSLDTLLRAADIAMYESKKIKSSVHIFEDRMKEGYLETIYIEQELRKAIEKDEFSMVYQPQFDCHGHFYGVESLVRWNNSTLGYVPPTKFIPIAETSGQMPLLGQFILKQSLEDMKTIHEALQTCFHTSVNISVKQFLDASFLEHLLSTIEQTGVCNVAITLEVTENLFIDDMNYILPLLHHIRSLGIEISMDDFGTGYSSLSILRKLPINELKIDKSFVDEICHDEGAKTMVQNIIAIGKNLGMHIVAEGVETDAQRIILSELGCDRFQGYYFSKPLSRDALLCFLKENPSLHSKDN